MPRPPIIIPGDIVRRTKRLLPYPGSPESRGRGGEYIPEFYKDFEVFDEFMRFVELVAPTFDMAKAAALSIPDLVSAERVDPQFFPDLARLLDFGFDEDRDIEVQRKELLKTLDAYLIRGTAPSVVRLARMLGADKAFVFTPFDYVKFLDTSRGVLSGGYRFEEIDFWRWGTYEVAARRVDFTRLLPKIKHEVHPAGTVIFGRLIIDLTDEDPPLDDPEIGLKQTKIFIILEDYTLLTVSRYVEYVEDDNPSGYWKLDESPDLVPSSGVPLYWGGMSRPANTHTAGTSSPPITHPDTNPNAYGYTIDDGILALLATYEAHYTYRNDGGETTANTTPASVTLTGTQNAIIVTYPEASGVTGPPTSARIYVAKGAVATEKLVVEDYLVGDPPAWSTGAFHSIGDRITPNTGSFYHICVKEGFSGITEPLWTAAAPADITIDNSVEWFAYPNTKQAVVVMAEAAIYGVYKYGAGVAGVPAFDASGNNLVGQYLEGVSRGHMGALVSGASTAAMFDGSTGRVQLPVSSLLKPGTGSWSLEAWLKIIPGVSGVAVGTRWNDGNNAIQLRVDLEQRVEFSIRHTFDVYPATNHVLLLTTMSQDLDHGDLSSVWTDSIGNNDYAQVLAASQPVFIEESDTVSRRPSLKFDGVDDSLAHATTLALSTTHALIIHFKCTAISSADEILALFGDNSVGSGGYVRYNHSLTTPAFEYRAGTTSNCFGVLTTPLSKNRWYTLAVNRNGTSVSFYLDGVQFGGTQTLGANPNFSLGVIGRDYIAGLHHFCGEIDEVLVYSTSQTANILNIQNNINDKYNVENSGRLVSFKTPQPMSDGKWHHYVGTLDVVNDKSIFFVDTNMVDMVAYTKSVNLDPGTARFLIGSRTTVSGHFNGEVDEVAIYQSALSFSSVSAHYHSAIGSIVTEERLSIQPHYRLAENVNLFATHPFIIGFSKLGSSDVLGTSSALLERVSAWIDPAPAFASGKDLTITASSQYISFPAAPTRVNTALNGSFSLEMWIRVDAGVAFHVWGVQGSDNSRSIKVNAGGTALDFIQGHATTPTVILSVPYTAATYMHVVFTYDVAAQDMFAYKNGNRTPVASNLTFAFAGAFNGDYRIGHNGATQTFRIDELRVYSRVLTPKEVEDHFNGIFLNETALEAWYSFDASTVVDNGPNAINGTVNGAAVAYNTHAVGVRPKYSIVTPNQVIALEFGAATNGVTTAFSFGLDHTNVIGKTVVIRSPGGIIATDNGSGTLSGTGVSSGTINYSTGAVSITYTVAPATGSITVDYWVTV